ncbi:MAG: ferritin-like domain-containing protein, partial [Rhodospirillales bacterium]
MITATATTLADLATDVLTTAEARAKAAAALTAAAAWEDGNVREIGETHPPDRPARPERPVLQSPGKMPRRRIGTLEGRIALLHAVAHIELNAIDLAWDIIARFPGMPRAFYDDWVSVGREEATHFRLIDDRLRELGASYGDHPAHDGLWKSAQSTADDLLARLAIVPLVLEARGLD